MNLLSWFEPKVINPGAIVEDPRIFTEKIKDYYIKEIVATAEPVVWTEKKPDDWRKFTLRNQDGSGSCVKQSLAKVAEVSYWLRTNEKEPFSAGFYNKRANYPEAGMFGVDAFNLWKNIGITTEKVLPSQNLSETQMNTIKGGQISLDLALPFKITGYTQFDAREDFEMIASTIQKTGKAVQVFFYFTYPEWTDIPATQNPYLKPWDKQALGHAVAVVDFCLYNGKKYLVIEDSWGKFNNWNGQRLISEEFFAARNTFGAYPINFKYLEGSGDKPKHTFTQDLKFSIPYYVHPEVKILQDVLKYEGVMPANTDSTGYYGAQTAAAVLKFQKKYKVAPDAELDVLGGKTVGPKTREALNQLYG